MYIVGISAYYHDSAAALLKDGEVIAAAQEERFSRTKNDASFPRQALSYCLSEAHIGWNDVDLVVFYDKPFLKFERILETVYRHAPFGFRSFIKGVPMWVKEKLFFKRMIRKELRLFEHYTPSRTPLLFAEHHLSHAASAFFASPFDQAAILTIDGVGEWATLSIAHGEGNTIRVLKEMHFPQSVGLLYSAFTHYLGFRVNAGEYKLMGLAPYAHRQNDQTKQHVERIKAHLVEIHPDGSITLNDRYFNYQRGTTMTDDKRWKQLFGIDRRMPESPLLPSHTFLACAAQIVVEEILLLLAREARRLTSSASLCMAGGVALNCVANGSLQRSSVFGQLYVQPAAGDAGGALGAALAAYYIYGNNPRTPQHPDAMKGALLGPSFSTDDALRAAVGLELHHRVFDTEEELCRFTAARLDEGLCVGWFQGRMEYGPRALGNRSIVADPRKIDMQQRVNRKIKFRESFRPFAPAILKEEAHRYFDPPSGSDYMLTTAFLAQPYRRSLPPHYHSLPMMEKLSVDRSEFQAVTHVDFSARVQTVDQHTNRRFRALLHAFHALTGCPMLINTSFNVRGEPIVCSPSDAIRCFLNTEMDLLVVENVLFWRKEKKM